MAADVKVAFIPTNQSVATIAEQLVFDLILGTSLAAIPVTLKAPYWRVAHLITMQHTNPDVVSGKVQPYAGLVDCLRRERAEHGLAALWRGNLASCFRDPLKLGAVLACNDFAAAHLLPKYDSTTNFWKKFGANVAAGGIAGVMSTALNSPLDFARARMYAESRKQREKTAAPNRGILDCVIKTVRQEGIAAMYAGSSVVFLNSLVHRAVQLGCFRQIEDVNPYHNNSTGIRSVGSSFLSAAVARVVAVLLSDPIDKVRLRLILDRQRAPADRHFRGPMHCATTVFAERGIRGLYRGLLRGVCHRLISESLVIVAYDRFAPYLRT